MDKIEFKFEISEKLCEDEVIGTLEYKESDNKYEFKLHEKYDETIIRNKSDYFDHYPEYKEFLDLVVILESPHIDEFKSEAKDKSGKKYRPANGVTGKRFKENFDTIINNKYSSKLRGEDYIVHVVNSIQYQCSLGIKPIYFRDYVWLTLWKRKDIRNSFEDRIKKINPKIIINCCTQGGHARDYKDDCFFMDEKNLHISKKYLEALGYEIEKSKISNLVKYEEDILLKYNKTSEITLKNFVKYQLSKINIKINFDEHYIEQSHPSYWF